MHSVSPDDYAPNGTVEVPLQKIVSLPPFRTGDVVVLKSGSPPLTVAAVEDDELAISWFTSDGQINLAKLSVTCFFPAEEGTA